MRESRSGVRNFYQLKAEKNHWSGRELERRMGSLLFERLAKSKDKNGLMKLACRGQEVIKPEDAIKKPIVLEFLGLPESHELVESKDVFLKFPNHCATIYNVHHWQIRKLLLSFGLKLNYITIKTGSLIFCKLFELN